MAKQLIWDYRKASPDQLGESDRALCDYAVSLTKAPGEMGQANVDKLKAVNFSDEQITIAVQVIGYFNYINRVADGLGVDLDPGMEEMFGGVVREDWLNGRGRFSG